MASEKKLISYNYANFRFHTGSYAFTFSYLKDCSYFLRNIKTNKLFLVENFFYSLLMILKRKKDTLSHFRILNDVNHNQVLTIVESYNYTSFRSHTAFASRNRSDKVKNIDFTKVNFKFYHPGNRSYRKTPFLRNFFFKKSDFLRRRSVKFVYNL